MRIKQIAKELEHVITELGQVRAIFGEPIKLETRTIVPVGAVMSGIGAGGGGLPLVSGGGGGGDVRVVPIGFLQERDGHVEFTAIEVAPELLRMHGKVDDKVAGQAVDGLVHRIRVQLGAKH